MQKLNKERTSRENVSNALQSVSIDCNRNEEFFDNDVECQSTPPTPPRVLSWSNYPSCPRNKSDYIGPNSDHNGPQRSSQRCFHSFYYYPTDNTSLRYKTIAPLQPSTDAKWGFMIQNLRVLTKKDIQWTIPETMYRDIERSRSQWSQNNDPISADMLDSIFQAVDLCFGGILKDAGDHIESVASRVTIRPVHVDCSRVNVNAFATTLVTLSHEVEFTIYTDLFQDFFDRYPNAHSGVFLLGVWVHSVPEALHVVFEHEMLHAYLGLMVPSFADSCDGHSFLFHVISQYYLGHLTAAIDVQIRDFSPTFHRVFQANRKGNVPIWLNISSDFRNYVGGTIVKDSWKLDTVDIVLDETSPLSTFMIDIDATSNSKQQCSIGSDRRIKNVRFCDIRFVKETDVSKPITIPRNLDSLSDKTYAEYALTTEIYNEG